MASGKDWPGEWADLPSGVDVTLIEESLRLTPTERLEKLQRFLEFHEELLRARARYPADR